MITEALLEMHFHRAMVELFTDTFGKRFLKLLKPSPQNETWVGFDQGWVSTDISSQDLFIELRNSVTTGLNTEKVYLAYFFQFKPVETMKRSSSYKPANYTTPYYRSEVSLKKNDRTGLSQHETLTRLGNSINNALVYYACAMLFNLNDIYEDPDLNKIKFVEVSTAPTNWASDERHFITFQSETDMSPLWCSDPIRTESINIEQITRRFEFMTASNLLSFLDSVTESIGISKYPNSLTILEFENGE